MDGSDTDNMASGFIDHTKVFDWTGVWDRYVTCEPLYLTREYLIYMYNYFCFKEPGNTIILPPGRIVLQVVNIL